MRAFHVEGYFTNIAAGTPINITLQDRYGNKAFATTYAKAGSNTYSADIDVTSLIDGRFVAIATSVSASGVPLRNIQRYENVDLIKGEIDSHVQADNAHHAININGESQDVYKGTEISVTITDKNGKQVTGTTTANADGSYSLNIDSSSLTDGEVTITTTTKDNNGHVITDTDTLELDQIAGSLTADGVINPENGTATVKGNATDVPNGTEVTITLTDEAGNKITTKAVVNNGSYQVEGIDVTSLKDGNITFTATTKDNNGNTLTATDTELLDLLPDGEIEIDHIVPNMANHQTITVTGHTSGVNAGEKVNVTITDNAGNHATARATVNADGTFSVDVNRSGLNFGKNPSQAGLTVKAVTHDVSGKEISDTEGFGVAHLNFMTYSMVTEDQTATYASYPTHSTHGTLTRDSKLGYQTSDNNDLIMVNNYVTGRSIIETHGAMMW